ALRQYPADDDTEIVHLHRLHTKGIDAKGLGLLSVYGVAEARTQNDRDIRTQPAHFARQSITGHVRHGLIGHDKIKALWTAAEGLQGRQAICIAYDVVAQAFEPGPLET